MAVEGDTPDESADVGVVCGCLVDASGQRRMRLMGKHRAAGAGIGTVSGVEREDVLDAVEAASGEFSRCEVLSQLDG